MSIDEGRRADFEIAMGQSFADAVCPPVPFEDASAQECVEAVRTVLGRGVAPETLAALAPRDLERLAAAFGDHFECDPPTALQVAEGVARTLARWPASA